MADLVVGLAKSVVDGALTKAHAAIEEEAKLRKSAQRDLVFITGEFEMMQSFLNVANEERVDNKVVKTWVRQIRELAYDVEDCIELVVHLDKKTRIWCRIRRLCLPWIPSPMLPLDQAVDEIEQLKARVQDVSTRNARYNLISDTGSKPVVVQQPPPVSGARTASNMLAEARDASMRQQGSGDLSRLVTNKDDDLRVISVWGSDGDHGITSIIRRTYTDPEICKNFNFRAWVKLMHPFNPHDFLRDSMAQFYRTGIQEEDGVRGIRALEKMQVPPGDLFQEFQNLITEGRYLVVLEDLSNMIEWDAVKAFLPNTKKGSWIIVSTHEAEIASLCIGDSCGILELKRFSAEHSVCALFKEVSQVDGDKGKEPMGSEMSRGSAYTKIISRKEGAEWRKNFSLVHGSQMTELHKYIAKARFSSSHAVSVWGIAGVGKSALVKNLYDDIIRVSDGRPFEMWRWVAVSQPFILRDFCWTLLSDSHSVVDPIEACRELLAQRCLVVIDDLQSTEEWDLIQDVLLSTSSRSVIIVITTEATIARHCCMNNEELVFNVKGLEADAAIDFFKKEVRRKNASSPLHYHGHGGGMEVEELILKCGGLPKIIAAVAGLLATQTVTLMDSVRSLNLGFMHHLETKPEIYNLQGLFSWMHSHFSNCPDFLKPCIFYLSIFPREQAIRRRRLVRRWIAEGYSRDGHNESAEENGEMHFSELLELSIVQHVTQLANQFDDTRQVFCQVNGFMREYIVSQRLGENLMFELGGNCALTSQRTGRHLSILQDWDRDRIVFETTDFSRLRSLTVFGHWKSFFISESMKMLRVLDLEDASGVEDKDLEEMVKWLRRLKFLSLRGCHGIFNLPWSLGDLRQLQTLDVRGTSIFTVPESIIKLKKLQYIRAGTRNDRLVPTSTQAVPSRWFSRRRHHGVGVEVPRRIGKLKVLHTIGVVNVVASGGNAILEELKKLTQLRKLGVSGVNMKNNKDFVSAISGHFHLESLSVHLEKDSEGCLDNISLPCEDLQSLKLYGLQDKLPLSGCYLCKLRKLDLEMATLMKSDIAFIAELPELCTLRIRVKQPQDGKLHFQSHMEGLELDTFKKVKILKIACSSSMLHVTFGSKSMVNLELLTFDCSSALYQLTGLNGLRELKQVLLKCTYDEGLKTDLENQLVNHPNRPVVKLEG